MQANSKENVKKNKPSQTRGKTPMQLQFEEENRLIKKKYQNVKVTSAIDKDNDEVFEQVVGSNPVLSNTLLRPGKMKWKEKEKEVEEKKEKTETGSCMIAVFEPNSKNKKKSDTCIGRKERDKDEQTRKDRKKKEEDEVLQKKIAMLEQENVDLKKKLIEVQTILTKREEQEKDKNDSLEENTQRLAIETLTIMKKNQILDTVLDLNGNRTLFNFFRECEKPNDNVATLVETALTRGLRYMVNCSDQIDCVISKQLRVFICDTVVAKKALLRMMFDHPELVPDMWGGGPLLLKIRKDKEDQEKTIREFKKE